MKWNNGKPTKIGLTFKYKINFKSSSFDNKTELVFVAEYFHGLKTAKFTDFSSRAMIAFQKI